MPERPHNDPPTDSLTTMSEAERDALQTAGWGGTKIRGVKVAAIDG